MVTNKHVKYHFDQLSILLFLLKLKSNIHLSALKSLDINHYFIFNSVLFTSTVLYLSINILFHITLCLMRSFRYFFCIGIVVLFLNINPAFAKEKPIRVAVAGMTHGHVGWILGRQNPGDIELVGLAEPNEELAKRLINRHKLDPDLWFSDLETMLEKVNPEAVCAFGSIYEHLEVVEKCAPLGIHVMVEKPLAVSMDHANKMNALAAEHNIYLLTNYETTWYPSNHKIHELTIAGTIGELRKIVVHDGHEGPIEIGCSKEFLGWLTDPVMNGGGAVIDFGCYGANLATWLMDNQRPVSVTAVTQQIKPNMYPNVDDEATIILEYPNAQAIIQASWNWPFCSYL